MNEKRKTLLEQMQAMKLKVQRSTEDCQEHQPTEKSGKPASLLSLIEHMRKRASSSQSCNIKP